MFFNNSQDIQNLLKYPDIYRDFDKCLFASTPFRILAPPGCLEIQFEIS